METISNLQTYLTYSQRATLSQNPTGIALLNLMDEKQTNLALSLDVTNKKDLLHFADLLGPHISVLKTHIDILDDFDEDTPKYLQDIAQKHKFLIFEDRKFADIGHTVKAQYQGGMYQICKWADIVNAHPIPGPGIINGLKDPGLKRGRGLLLIAEMSSEGNWTSSDYAKKTAALAKDHADFVIGFITQRKISDDPSMIHFTPGIHLSDCTDSLGQRYQTPETAIGKNFSDLLIVGRGIYADPNPSEKAKIYRDRGWSSYLKRATF